MARDVTEFLQLKSDCPVWCPLFVSLFVVVSYFFVVQLLQAQSPHPSFVVPGNVLELSVVVFSTIFCAVQCITI